MHVISPNSSPGPSSATGWSYARSTGASIGIERRSASSSRRSSSRGDSRLVSLLVSRARKPLGRALRLHVRDGSGERDAGLAFQNVKRGRAEFAFAAHDVAALEMPPDRRVRIFLEKLRRNILEDRQPQKIFGRHGRPVRLPLHVFQLFKKQAGAPRRRWTRAGMAASRQNSYNRPRLSSPSSPGRGFP